jgi:hypothetical protein
MLFFGVPEGKNTPKKIYRAYKLSSVAMKFLGSLKELARER